MTLCFPLNTKLYSTFTCKKEPLPLHCRGGCSLQPLYHNLLRCLKIHPRAFLKWNSIGVKTINVLTTAIANRKLFFNGFKLCDSQWLLTGKVLEVEFENEQAKKNVSPHEVEQAKRLTQRGITCVFQVDYEVD